MIDQMNIEILITLRKQSDFRKYFANTSRKGDLAESRKKK